MRRGLPHRAERAAALGPAAVPPVRAGPRPHHADAGRRQRRLPGQPPAGRPAPHLPRLRRDDAPDRAAGPAAPGQRHRAKRRRKPAGARPSSGCTAIARATPRVRPAAPLPAGPLQFGGRLRTIGVGASALDVELAQRWMEMGVDVLQGYGATEMSPVISFTRPSRNRLGTVGRGDPAASRSGSPRTARSWPADRTASRATGRTPRRRRR